MMRDFKVLSTDERSCMSVLLPKQVNPTNEHYHYVFLIETSNVDAWNGIEEFAELLVTHESLHAVLNLRVSHDAAKKLDDLPFEDRFCITDQAE